MISTLRDYRFNKDIDDIRGSAIYGPGEQKLGKIDDVVFDGETGNIKYFIVDTGGWLKSRRFLVPPDHVQTYPENEKDFFINLSKAEIERFPALDGKVLESERDFTSYETSYRSSWTSPPASAAATASSHSPLSPRFLRFQDEIVRNREGICGTDREVPRRKVG
jgi:sporulation protein YlmC with PRC-barrel domain